MINLEVKGTVCEMVANMTAEDVSIGYIWPALSQTAHRWMGHSYNVTLKCCYGN